MLMDILPKKSIWYIIHKFLRHERSVSSETILISNPCFKYLLSFSIRIFFFNRWQMYVHNLLKPVGWLHSQQRWSKRAPDLAWFSRYSLFGPLHFSSSVYILACLLNDGAKRNRLLYLKIMYTQVRKILHLQ